MAGFDAFGVKKALDLKQLQTDISRSFTLNSMKSFNVDFAKANSKLRGA